MMTVDTLSYATGGSALGRVLVARSISGVCAILIGADDNELVKDLVVRFPEAKLEADEAVVQDDLAKITRFVDKPSEGFWRLTCVGRRSSAGFGRHCRMIPVGTTPDFFG